MTHQTQRSPLEKTPSNKEVYCLDPERDKTRFLRNLNTKEKNNTKPRMIAIEMVNECYLKNDISGLLAECSD